MGLGVLAGAWASAIEAHPTSFHFETGYSSVAEAGLQLPCGLCSRVMCRQKHESVPALLEQFLFGLLVFYRFIRQIKSTKTREKTKREQGGAAPQQ